MPTETHCFASVKGLMMRGTRLNDCGAPVAPPCNAVVSKGFVSINFTVQVEDGEEYKVKNADGSFAINETDNPAIQFFGVEATFTKVDPDLFELAAGAQVLTDYSGNNVGVAFEDTPRDQVFALEVWTKIPGQACVAGQQEWVYWLAPQIVNGIVGDFNIENALASFTIKGQTKGHSGWGQGIADVIWTAASTPGKIPAVGANVHLLGRRTPVAPPAGSDCGCIDIVLPV